MRRAYLDGILELIDRRRKDALSKHADLRDDLFEKQEQYRAAFYEMLGEPLTAPMPQTPPDVQKTLLFSEDGISVYRCQTMLLDCVPFYGMLFLHQDGKKRPLVIACHGGDGTPEVASGILPDGSFNYNDMIHRILTCGANVYAPQLLLWNTEKFPVTIENRASTDQMRRTCDTRLRQTGSSITAIEIYGIRRVLDALCTQPTVDADKIGMIGLSYGGFYTLYTTACDTRIKASLSACFFNDRMHYPWSDWVWDNAANKFLDAEVLCLIYPRKICIQLGTKDPTFDIHTAREEIERFYKIAGDRRDFVTFEEFDGVHEFSTDNLPIKRLLAQLNGNA